MYRNSTFGSLPLIEDCELYSTNIFISNFTVKLRSKLDAGILQDNNNNLPNSDSTFNIRN